MGTAHHESWFPSSCLGTTLLAKLPLGQKISRIISRLWVIQGCPQAELGVKFAFPSRSLGTRNEGCPTGAAGVKPEPARINCAPKREPGNGRKNRKPKTIFILQAPQVRGDVGWALPTMNPGSQAPAWEPPCLPSSCLAKDITQYQQVVGDTRMSPSRAWGKICVPRQELGNKMKGRSEAISLIKKLSVSVNQPGNGVSWFPLRYLKPIEGSLPTCRCSPLQGLCLLRGRGEGDTATGGKNGGRKILIHPVSGFPVV